MKLKFTIILSSEKASFQERMEAAYEQNPDLPSDLAHGIAQAILMVFRFKKDDLIALEKLDIEKIFEEPNSL